MGGKSKTLLGIVNKLLKIKSLMTSRSNVLPYYLKQVAAGSNQSFTGSIDGVDNIFSEKL